MAKKHSDPNSVISSVLSDVNAIVPHFLSLAEAYRLTAGAAEELSRTPNAPFEIVKRALIRSDRTGELIDILLELLCCKLKFSSQFLAVTGAPVDIIEQLSQCEASNRQTAEQIILIEAMRRFLAGLDQNNSSCFNTPPIFKTAAKPGAASPPQPQFAAEEFDEELAEIFPETFERK